jgi:hypothetical protein
LGYKLISTRPYFSLLIQLINSFEVSSYALALSYGDNTTSRTLTKYALSSSTLHVADETNSKRRLPLCTGSCTG